MSDSHCPTERDNLNYIKCWNSNELFKLDLEYLSDIITIVSLSTGLFKLCSPTHRTRMSTDSVLAHRTFQTYEDSLSESEKIVVAVLFIQQADGSADRFKTIINFYENIYLGTAKDPSIGEGIGELINTGKRIIFLKNFSTKTIFNEKTRCQKKRIFSTVN